MLPCMLDEFLSKPNIDCDNGPCVQNNLSIYLSIYLFMHHIILVPDICVYPELICVFWYIDVLVCIIYK